MTMQAAGVDGLAFAPVIERESATAEVVLVCEHASNVIPEPWGTLGLTPAQRQAHIAWDPGALAVARGLSTELDATLVHATVSRLVYDVNRAPDQAGAMPVRSEMHDIPGNRDLGPADRLARTEAVYLPFHVAIRGLVVRRLALGRRPVIITVHSFTPTWFGTPRSVEFGVINDSDAQLAKAIAERARSRTGMDCRLNEPYSAEDDVTHTLRLQATPFGLRAAMLEIRNDLIATPGDCAAMAASLAPVIASAVDAVTCAPAVEAAG